MDDFLDQVFLTGPWSETSRPSWIGSDANETVDDLRNVYERNDVNLQVNGSHFMRGSNMTASIMEDNMEHMVAKGPMDDRIHLNKLVDTSFKLDSLNAPSTAGFVQLPRNWPSQYNSVPLPAPTIRQERTNGYGLQSGSMDREESVLPDELGFIGSLPLDQDGLQKTHPLNFTDRHLGFFGATGGIQAQSKVLLSEETNSAAQYGNQVTLSQFQSPTPAAVSSQIASKPRVRARRGQATDPHSIAERLRREKIAERLKNLQELVPNSNKTDKASSLDEIIEYVKFLQHQVKILSMSRVGAAGAVLPLITDIQSEGSKNLLQAVGGSVPDSPHSPDDVAFEQEVVKLMESNITSAMQFLQSKGLCLMPIALAAAMSTGKLPSNTQNPDWVKTLLPLGANGNVAGLQYATDSEPQKDTGDKILTNGCNGPLKQEVQTLKLK